MGDYRENISAVRRATHGIGVLHTKEAARRHIGRPDQLKRFDARNIMTDEIVEYRMLNTSTQPGRGGGDDARPMLVEISYSWFLDKPLYGITVFDLRLDVEPKDHDLSTAVQDAAAVADHLRSLVGMSATD